MDKQENNELRARARALMSSGHHNKSEFSGDLQELLEELNVYMAELEAQNEELNQAYVCIEEQSRDNFALFEHAPIAYCVLSDDDRVIKLNKRCRELFVDQGNSQKQFLPMVYKTAQLATGLYSWLFEDKSQTITIKFANDPDIWHLLEKKPYHSNQKLIAITDITSQVKSQEKLKQKTRQAQQANDARAHFLTTMSHEFRTPLTGIMGFISLLEEESLSESALQKLHGVHSSAQGLLTILDNMATLSKLSDTKLLLNKSDFDIHALLEQTVTSFANKLSNNMLSLNVDINEDIPRCIHSDKDKIEQILNNLIDNAVKFTSLGTVTVSAALSDHEPPRLRIIVEDTGEGISVNNIDELFEEFIPVQSSLHRKQQGAGLGLAICRKLTDLLGGSIDARRGKSGGSQFWFTIPLEIATTDSAEAESVDTTVPLDLKPMRILVAEDNQTNRLIMQTMLEKMGHFVSVVENGQEAINSFHKYDFDVIIMDSHMPVMTGYQASQIIRSSIKDQPNPIPILSWTADVRHEHINHVLKMGMNGVLSKPIDREELSEVLSKLSKSPHRLNF